MQKRTKIITTIVVFIILPALFFPQKTTSSILQKLPQSSSVYPLSTIDSLKDSAYAQKIARFYKSGSVARFNGEEDLSIYTISFFNNDTTTDTLGNISISSGKAIFISSGRTEAAVKYQELIFDLYNSGFSVFVIDHRGQGLSGRMTEDSTMGYIEDFSYYIKDAKHYYDSIVVPSNPTKIFLLAHSLGGGIAAEYLETHPTDFDAAVLSSPMLGLPFPTCPGIGLFVKKEPNYAPGMKPYSEYDTTFANTKLTTSEFRFARMNRAFDNEPSAALGGASAQWVQRSCKAFKQIFENVDSITTPLILFSASQEAIVSPKAHTKFIKKLQKEGKDATGYEVIGGKHELFIEQDSIRTRVLTTILDFYNQQ